MFVDETFTATATAPAFGEARGYGNATETLYARCSEGMLYARCMGRVAYEGRHLLRGPFDTEAFRLSPQRFRLKVTR
ncbi:MAG: hypothetical protein LBT55_00320 [Clostridiaceae bacterium]|nr:hypothetical protein [Clostridiaceae bacterium]